MEIQYQYRIGSLQLERLFIALASEGFKNIGPVFRDGTVMIDPIESWHDIASGCYEKIGKGKYEIIDNGDKSLFQYTLSPQSFKKYLHPPKRKLWEADKAERGFSISQSEQPDKMAFWGIRSCDLEALEVLDRVFLNDTFENNWYAKASAGLFIIATGCSIPSPNCFCTTVGSGPEPIKKYDLSLVEIKEGNSFYYLVSVGSSRGQMLADELKFKKASKKDVEAARATLSNAVSQMDKRFDPKQVAKTLKQHMDHGHWKEVAEKCLSCANCTMVCPTCFCTSTEDITDITGEHTERWLRWDSCFNGDFSYIHGGQVRSSTKSRYRQWLTHKMSNWYDQFGTSGCVECGRCITWCPVGIDLTEEINLICN